MQQCKVPNAYKTESSECCNVRLYFQIFMVVNPLILIFICKIIYTEKMCMFLIASMAIKKTTTQKHFGRNKIGIFRV